jgi:hypothetical protein
MAIVSHIHRRGNRVQLTLDAIQNDSEPELEYEVWAAIATIAQGMLTRQKLRAASAAAQAVSTVKKAQQRSSQ